MREHEDSNDAQDAFGEPDDGWVTADQKVDSEVVALFLCRFTGDQLRHDEPCLARTVRSHPDVECRALYVQGEALEKGHTSLERFDDLVVPEQFRIPFDSTGDSSQRGT